MGWLGSASVLVGMWFIGRKNRFGFLLGVLGECFWFARGFQASECDLMLLAVVFIAMNAWNWHKWGRKESRSLPFHANLAARTTRLQLYKGD